MSTQNRVDNRDVEPHVTEKVEVSIRGLILSFEIERKNISNEKKKLILTASDRFQERSSNILSWEAEYKSVKL